MLEMKSTLCIIVILIQNTVIQSQISSLDDSVDYEFDGDIILYDDEEHPDELYGDSVSSPSRLWSKIDNEVRIPFILPPDTPEFDLSQIQRAID